jgi:hypothetical protein
MNIDFMKIDADDFSKILPAHRMKNDIRNKSYRFYRGNDASHLAILTYDKGKNKFDILANTDFIHKGKKYYKKKLYDEIIRAIGKDVKDGQYSFVFDAKEEKLLFDLVDNIQLYWISSFPPKVEKNNFYFVTFFDEKTNKGGVARIKEDTDNLVSIANFYNASKYLTSVKKRNADGIKCAYQLISASLGLPYKTGNWVNHIPDHLSDLNLDPDKILNSNLVHEDFSITAFVSEDFDDENENEDENEKKELCTLKESYTLSEILETGLVKFKDVKYAQVILDIDDFYNKLGIDVYLGYIDTGTLILYATNISGKIWAEEMDKLKEFFNSDNVILCDNLNYQFIGSDSLFGYGF